MIRIALISFRYLILVWMLAASLSCGKKEQSEAAARTQVRKFPVVVEYAKVQDVVYKIESVGTLEAEEDVEIPARVDGAVGKVYFKEGDRVTTDKVLIEIDPERYQLEIERAKAELEKAKAEVKDAEQAYEQRESLRKQDPGWVTQEELRKLQTALDRARAELARAGVELALAQKRFRDSRVRSPFSGVINSKDVSTGEYVKPETMIATIARVETLKLKFNIPEVDAARIQVGQEVKFTVRALPQKVFQAKIFFISTTANPETRMVEVKAYTDNLDLQLRPGYFASVSLDTSVHKSAVLVLEEAVIPTETGFVSFVVQQGVAYRKAIEIGQRSGGRVEILKGIQEGEMVVIRGGHSLNDGMPVDAKTGT